MSTFRIESAKKIQEDTRRYKKIFVLMATPRNADLVEYVRLRISYSDVTRYGKKRAKPRRVIGLAFHSPRRRVRRHHFILLSLSQDHD